MREPAVKNRNEAGKVVAALLLLIMVIVFFIVPLFTSNRSRRKARRPVRDHVVMLIEDEEAATAENASVDLLRKYGSWPGTEAVREVFTRDEVGAKSEGR